MYLLFPKRSWHYSSLAGLVGGGSISGSEVSGGLISGSDEFGGLISGSWLPGGISLGGLLGIESSCGGDISFCGRGFGFSS